MNIVKLKDQIKPGDDFFNKYLKGKYAWWIHMRYIVPFELMGVHGYIACEENIEDLFKLPFKAEFRDTYENDIWPYIDTESTDKANTWAEFKLKNQYTTSAELTIEEVKQFRTWLARTLLSFDVDSKGNQINELFNQDETYTLQYYSNSMYNEVVKQLSNLGNKVIYDSSTNKCGCGGNNTYLNLNVVDTCNPLTIYRESVYNKMVVMFSNLDFWTRFDTEFLKTFKLYIDNILNLDLTMESSEFINVYADCTCTPSKSSYNRSILERLSTSLEYMISNKVIGHKNYISDSLKDWATVLYEKMYW